MVLPRSDEFVERLIPILYRLSVHSHNDVPDDCRADCFVSNGKVNVWPVAAVEFQDWPYRRAHLLALHVGGVTTNTHSE